MRQSTIGVVLFVVLAGVAVAGCKPLNRQTYEVCYASSDCTNVNDTCVLIQNGSSTDRMCTQTCSVGADCPTSRNGDFGVCMAASVANVCYSACNSDSDCPGTWKCEPSTRPGINVCLPR